MRRRRVRPILLVAILSLTGLLDTEAVARGAAVGRMLVAARQAEELFAAVEERLLAHPAWAVRAEITSTGAFDSSLSATVAVRRGNRAVIELDGSFGDSAVDTHLASDGGSLLFPDVRGEVTELPVPAALNEALAIGLTRMGLLHNFARLIAGAPPDHMEGGVREWVQVTDLALGEAEALDGREARPLSFGIVVAGTPSGEATLWVDEATLFPILRRQMVRFETGAMHVTERYEFEDLTERRHAADRRLPLGPAILEERYP